MFSTLLLLAAAAAGVSSTQLLGADRCSWGPSYWCTSLREAKECGSVQFCVESVWVNGVPPQVDGIPSQELSATEAEVEGPVSCAVCKAVIYAMKEVMTEEPYISIIKNGLKKLCAYLPTQQAELCQDYVDAYLDQLIEYLKVLLDPEQVCTMAGLCTSELTDESDVSLRVEIKKALVRVMEKPVSTKPEGASCTVCKVVIDMIKTVMTDEPFPSLIKSGLKKLCALLPTQEAEMCEDYVDAYTDQVIEYLKVLLDPEQVCSLAGFCSSELSEKSVEFRNAILRAIQREDVTSNPEVKGIACEVCKEIIDAMKMIMTEEPFVGMIKMALKQLCALLPTQQAELCDDYVDAYADQVIEYLKTLLDADQVCEAVGLCTSGVPEKSELGIQLLKKIIRKSLKKYD